MINECYIIKEPIHAITVEPPRGKIFRKVSLRPLTVIFTSNQFQKVFHFELQNRKVNEAVLDN